MRSALVLCLLCLLATAAGGCATYEYNLVQPADLTRHIGSKGDEVVSVDPLQYRLRAVDNRLVMRIVNPTEDPIELVGPRSTVVDPAGQSHPLRAQTIAPNSFIKLIFPPIRPHVYDPSPTFGVGFYGYHHVDAYPYPYYYPYYYPYRPYSFGPWYGPYYPAFGYYDYYGGPQYLAVVDENDATYWDWPGSGGQMRLVITYRRAGKEFQQTFVFNRQKM